MRLNNTWGGVLFDFILHPPHVLFFFILPSDIKMLNSFIHTPPSTPVSLHSPVIYIGNINIHIDWLSIRDQGIIKIHIDWLSIRDKGNMKTYIAWLSIRNPYKITQKYNIYVAIPIAKRMYLTGPGSETGVLGGDRTKILLGQYEIL